MNIMCKHPYIADSMIRPCFLLKKEYVLMNCKPNTQSGYRRLIDLHIKPAIGIYQLKKITPARLQELINIKYRNGFSKNYLSKSKRLATKYEYKKCLLNKAY